MSNTQLLANMPITVLITGACSGIGYEAVKLLLESNKLNVIYRVIMTDLTDKRVNEAAERIRLELEYTKSKNELVPLVLDISSDESIQRAYQFVEENFGMLDVLLNNAGAQWDSAFGAGNMSIRECFTKSFDVNASSPNIMAWTFMPLLLKSPRARILFTTSGLAQITIANEQYFPTPEQPAGWPKKIEDETIAYRCSKLALNMLILDWAHKLKADGVKIHGIDPGFCYTNISSSPEKVKAMGGLHPKEGAIVYKAVIEGEMDAFVGKVINKYGLAPM